DAGGSVLAGATVTATQASFGRVFAFVTDSTGEYLFPQLPVGRYNLVVSAQGFKAALSNINVHVSEKLRCDFTMVLSTRTDVINVDAADIALQSESAEIKDVVLQGQVTDLPLKGRQFLDLATMTPGVVRPPGGTRGDALQQAGSLINVLGQ